MIRTELKRGTAELAVLSVLEEGPLHGYEIGRRIEEQSGGTLRYTLAALYPLAVPHGASRMVARRVGDRGEREKAALLPVVAAGPQDVEADAGRMGGFVSGAAACGEGDACVTGVDT